MYIIINNTTGQRFKHEGNYPLRPIYKMLNNGEDLIVISLYSNTIKVPFKEDTINGEVEWSSKEYPIPTGMINQSWLESQYTKECMSCTNMIPKTAVQCEDCMASEYEAYKQLIQDSKDGL